MDISINRMQYVFLCSVWSWVYLFISDRPNSLIEFLLGWVVNEVWRVLFLAGRSFAFLFSCPWRAFCISPIYFGLLLGFLLMA